MFGFLKDKLSQAIKKFSKSAEEEVVEQKPDDDAIARAADQENAQAAKPAKKPAPRGAPASMPPKAKPPKEEASRAAPTPARIPAKETAPKAAPATQPRKPVAKAPPSRSSPAREITKAPAKAAPAAAKTAPEKAASGAAEKGKKPSFLGKLFGKREDATEKGRAAETHAQGPAEERRLEREEPLERKEEEETIVEEERVPEPAAPDGEILEPAEEEGPEEESGDHEEKVADEEEEEPEAAQEPQGFFGKLKEAFTKKTLSEEKFDELFWELEVAMLENSVAVEVIEKIKQDLKDELTSGKVSRLGIDEMIARRLRQSIEELFSVGPFDLVERAKVAPKPYRICIIGVNGSGKTTTLAKLIRLFQKGGMSVVVAASDTFRAAAIDQLREHTDRLSVKLISQGYGADPAAVAFDAIEHAKAKGADVVLIDTAGRLHSNTNLMAELEKVVRVAKPDLKIFVGEAITGNDCVEQAKVFDKLVGIDAVILAKADIDEKGGAAISVSYVTGKPILYLGTGQTYDDLEPFDREKVIEAVGL